MLVPSYDWLTSNSNHSRQHESISDTKCYKRSSIIHFMQASSLLISVEEKQALTLNHTGQTKTDVVEPIWNSLYHSININERYINRTWFTLVLSILLHSDNTVYDT